MQLYPDTTKAVYHLYPFLFDTKQFKGMSRSLFMQSFKAEGIPCSPGYTPLHTQPFIQSAFESQLYQKIYAKEELNYARYMADNQCPSNDKLCNEQAIWMTQNLLLESRSSMDDIVNAVEKIQRNADKIVAKFKP